MNNTATNNNNTAASFEMVFTMGLPAAGKSYTAALEYPSHDTIDPDAIKESHPDYDPKNPAALHAWSQEVTESLFAAAIETPSKNLVIDGTGTNTDKMIARMTAAAAAGFNVSLLFVTCELETSIRRNSERARVVPVEVIRSKATQISAAFETLRTFASTVRVIENN